MEDDKSHLFNRNVHCHVANSKNAQKRGVKTTWVVSNLELRLKASPLLHPCFDAICLLLRLLKQMCAMEDLSLILLIKPGDQQGDLQRPTICSVVFFVTSSLSIQIVYFVLSRPSRQVHEMHEHLCCALKL